MTSGSIFCYNRPCWKGDRAVYGACLENRCGATHRGFESLPFRQNKTTGFSASGFVLRQLCRGFERNCQWQFPGHHPILAHRAKLKARYKTGLLVWRRERDSNPRWKSLPTSTLAKCPLQPLGYLSNAKYCTTIPPCWRTFLLAAIVLLLCRVITM